MISYVILFSISFILTFVIKKFSLKKSLLILPNERSAHKIPTPHGGGIAIALVWFSGIIYLFIYKAIDPLLFYALICGSLLSCVSYLDDLYELSPKIRLSVQAIVSLIGLYLLGGLIKIDFGFWILENQFITNTLAFIGIMWSINLYNFLDGIDGYAGSEAVFLGLSGWLFWGGNHFIVLIMAVSGFLVWNSPRAKIFMGDVGSTLLGYTIAIFAIYYQNNGASIFIWIILFSLFWFDATLTLIRRYCNKEKLFLAHSKHAYQRLTQSGIPHYFVVLYAFGINIILLIFGYSAFLNPKLIILNVITVVVLLYIVMRIVDNQKKFK